MKKILAVICFGFLSLSFANAGILTLGVSGNASLLSVDGKETVSGATGGDVIWGATAAAARTAATATAATTQSKSDDLAIGYLTLFGELGLFDTGLRLGLSYVPYALESETTENNRNDNCSNDESHLDANDVSDADVNVCSQTTNKVGVDLEDLMTMYVAYHHDLDLPFISSVFVKAGLIEADVITRETLTSGSQYGNTSLSGDFFGLGVEKNLEEQGLFVRLEGAITQYDTIKLTNTNSENTNTIDITGMDGATATISIGKTF
jgi:hypothetical protein